MNLAVGVAAGAVMAFCGVDDPLLWGTIAFSSITFRSSGP